MTVQELITRFKDEVPFVLSEITTDKMTRAFEKAVDHYNKFNPIVRTESISSWSQVYNFPVDTAPNAILRVYNYSIGLYNNGVGDLMWNWTYERPALYIFPGMYYVVCAYNITMANVDFAEHDLLEESVRLNLIKILSNKRRMATMNDLPFDLKGDQFYQEADSELRELRQKIEELTPVHH